MCNGNRVTKVNMKIKESNGMKAICNVVINDFISINDIRVVENRDGRLIVAMPSKKMPDNRFKDCANPVSAEARKIIETAVLEKYEEITTLTDEFLDLIS